MKGHSWTSLVATAESGQNQTFAVAAEFGAKTGPSRQPAKQEDYVKPADQLVDLAKRAEHKLGEVFDAPEVLPFASKAIDLVGSFPALRKDFENKFRTMREYAPKEFVQVCMHALRWPELRSFFEEQSRLAIAGNDWSAIADYGKYLDAFEDDWEDARTFYARYFVDAAND